MVAKWNARVTNRYQLAKRRGPTRAERRRPRRELQFVVEEPAFRGRRRGVGFSIAPMSATLHAMRVRTGWELHARRVRMLLRVTLGSLLAVVVLVGVAAPDASAAQGRDDDNGRGRQESDNRGRGNDDRGPSSGPGNGDDRGRAPAPPPTAPPPVSVAPRPAPVPVPPPPPVTPAPPPVVPAAPVAPPVTPAAPVPPPVTTAAPPATSAAGPAVPSASSVTPSAPAARREPDVRRHGIGRAPVERGNGAAQCRVAGQLCYRARSDRKRAARAVAAGAREQWRDVDRRRIRRPADRCRRRESPVRTVPAGLVVARQWAVTVRARVPRRGRGGAHPLLVRPARARPRRVLGFRSAPRAPRPSALRRLTRSFAGARYQMRVGPTSKAIDVASSGIASSGHLHLGHGRRLDLDGDLAHEVHVEAVDLRPRWRRASPRPRPGRRR